MGRGSVLQVQPPDADPDMQPYIPDFLGRYVHAFSL